jgi:hypothetical protein
MTFKECRGPIVIVTAYIGSAVGGFYTHKATDGLIPWWIVCFSITGLLLLTYRKWSGE